MSSTFCAVCLGNLNEAAVLGVSEIVAISPPSGPQAQICGHVLHRYCAERTIRDRDRKGSCPLCRAAFRLEDLKNVHLEFNTPTCDTCESSNDIVKSLETALEEKDEKIAKLQAQVESLKLTEARREAGSRIHLDREFRDSTCYNCESKDHTSLACPNPPYLRAIEATKYDKWAPIQKFKVFSKIPFDFENAGKMISFFSKKLSLRSLNRIQIQAFIAFSFFDDCCWNCASPYHHRGDCKNEDMGIKGLCKLLHEINHPLTEEAAAKRDYYRERAQLEKDELGAHRIQRKN